MKCQKTKGNWNGCYSPTACDSFGYCRYRNIAAGNMKNVSDADQAEWRYLDNSEFLACDDRYFVTYNDEVVEFSDYDQAMEWRP